MGVCNHDWVPSDRQDYSVCVTCGSFRSDIAPQPIFVYTADYWTNERGHSTLDEQIFNIDTHRENGMSKSEFLLSRIAVEKRLYALDIGCAPGIFLKRLYQDAEFGNVQGIEIEPSWSDDIKRIAGFDVPLLFGTFPECTKDNPGNRFNLIVASDVFEHSHKPWPFLMECGRLLQEGGQLLLMLPLVMNGAQMPDRMFIAEEHVWLHSARNLIAMLQQAGFNKINISKWADGHDVISAFYEGTEPNRLRAS